MVETMDLNQVGFDTNLYVHQKSCQECIFVYTLIESG